MDLLTCDCPQTDAFDGIVATYDDLPVDGTADVGEIWLVRENTGTWLLNRKPAGLYQRINDTGDRDTDWQYLGEWLEEFSDANFQLYNGVDNSKVMEFDLSGIGTGQTRTLKVPDASGTIALTGAITGAGFTMSTGKILGRTTASSGAIEEIAAGSGLSLAAGTLTIDTTVSTLTGTQTLTNKTLTAPTIAGGTHTGLASLGIRSSGSGAFDLTLANSENLTAGRTLTVALGDASRTLTLTGNASVSGTNTGDQTSVSGNAGTATKLATARNINGIAFDGSAAITIAAAAGTLTGSALASGVTGSSLTSVGTLGTGVWNATAIGVGFGGTGLASYTIGDLLYASGTTALSKLAAVAVGQVLVSQGTSTAPIWSDTPLVAALLIGTATTYGSPLGFTPASQIASTGAAGSALMSTRWSTNVAGARWILGKARSSTVGTAGAVQTSDECGEFLWAGNDGTAFIAAASIVAINEQNAATSDVRAAIAFRHYTGNTPTEHARLTFTGNWLVGTTSETGLTGGGGLSVGSATDASSTTAAAVIVAGGLGVAKKGFFGDLVSAQSVLVRTTTAAVGIAGSSIANSFNGTGAGTQGSIQLGQWSNDTTTVSVDIIKSHGTTVGSQGAIQTGEFLGSMRFGASDGTNILRGARIAAQAEATATTGALKASLLFSVSTADAFLTALTLKSDLSATFGSTIATADPTNGSGAWLLGKIRTGLGLAVLATGGLQVKVDGTLYTLAVLTTNP